MLRSKKTHKLFFNEWPYKIELSLEGSHLIFRWGLERTKEWLDGSQTYHHVWKKANRVQIRKFIDKLFPLLSKYESKVRVETSKVSVYIKDTDVLGVFKKELHEWIDYVTEPDSEVEYNFLMSNNSKKRVICNQYPKKKYRYKVYLKEQMVRDARENFYKWVNIYGDRFSLTTSTKRWLSGELPYAIAPYFYVEDPKTLSMTGLYLGSNIRTVEEFITREQINTSCPI